jgi:hypothetical protein
VGVDLSLEHETNLGRHTLGRHVGRPNDHDQVLDSGSSCGVADRPGRLSSEAPASAMHHESRKRRQLEALLRSSLEQLTDDDLQNVDLDEIADRLGIEIPEDPEG